MRLPRLIARRCARIVGWLTRDQRAASAVEYGLIAALVVITMIASFKLVANATVSMWGNVHTQIGNATGN